MIERLIILALASAVVAQDSRRTDYVPYAGHDLARAVTVRDAGAGKKTVSVDMRVVVDTVNGRDGAELFAVSGR
jgi:hypothetical protein